MPQDRLEKSTLIKAAGFALGLVVGAVLGPIVFQRFQWSDPAAAAVGSPIGGVCVYALVSAALLIEKRRRDRELLFAATSVRKETGLPESITITVKNAHLTLVGEVDDYSQRQQAERILSAVPGIKGVTNKIRLRAPAGQADPADIKKRIEENLLRDAELDSRRIHVVIDRSRVILEGTVSSWVAASEAEQIAWNVPGIQEVENRLDIVA